MKGEKVENWPYGLVECAKTLKYSIVILRKEKEHPLDSCIFSSANTIKHIEAVRYDTLKQNTNERSRHRGADEVVLGTG